MTPDQIANLRRLLAAATPGPWAIVRDIDEGVPVRGPVGESVATAWLDDPSGTPGVTDADLIVALRNDAAALLDAVERLTAERDAARADADASRALLCDLAAAVDAGDVFWRGAVAMRSKAAAYCDARAVEWSLNPRAGNWAAHCADAIREMPIPEAA